MEAKQTNGQSDPPPFAFTSKPLPGERAEVSMVKTGVHADGASVWQIQQNYQMGAMKPPTDQLILEDREPREGCEIVEMLTYGSLYLEADRKTAQIQYLPGTPPRVTMSEARLAQYYWPAFIGCLRFHQMLENQSGDLITHPMPACWNSPDTTGCLDNFVNTPFVDEYVRRQREETTVVKTEPPDVEMSDALPAFLQQDDESTSGESDSSASTKDKARSTPPESSVNTLSISTPRTVPSTSVSPLSTQPTSTSTASTPIIVASTGVLPLSTQSSSTSMTRTLASTSVMPLAPELPTQSTGAKQLSTPISVVKVPGTMPLASPAPSVKTATVAVQHKGGTIGHWPKEHLWTEHRTWSAARVVKVPALPKHSATTVTSAVQPWQQMPAAELPMANTSTSDTMAEMDMPKWKGEKREKTEERKAKDKLRYKENRRKLRKARTLAMKGVIQQEEGEIFDVQSVAHQQSRRHRGLGPQRGLQFRPRGPHSPAKRSVRLQPYPRPSHSLARNGEWAEPYPHPSHPPMYNQQAVEPFHAPPSFQDNSAPHDHFYAPHPQRPYRPPDHVDGCRCQPCLEAQWS